MDYEDMVIGEERNVSEKTNLIKNRQILVKKRYSYTHTLCTRRFCITLYCLLYCIEYHTKILFVIVY